MGLLGILTGNGNGKNSSDNSQIEDIRYLVHNHVFSDSLKGIHELVGEALEELGEKGPKLKNPQTNQQRYITVNDYEMEYNAAVDRISEILHGISQKAGKDEFAKLREYCLDAIEEFGMGSVDYAYLRNQISILKGHPEKIELQEVSVKLSKDYLRNTKIDEITKILGPDSDGVDAIKVNIDNLQPIYDQLGGLIFLKSKIKDLNEFYDALEKTLSRQEVRETIELIEGRESTSSSTSSTVGVVIPQTPAVDEVFGLKSKVEKIIGQEINVGALYGFKERVKCLIDLGARVEDPVALYKKFEDLIAKKNNYREREETLQKLKEEHEASFHNIDKFLECNFAAPQGLLYIFEKIREAYEKEGIGGAMDFAEALYLPFRNEREIQLPVKQEYADLVIKLWDSGIKAEPLNELACRTNELIQLCVQENAEKGNRLDVTNNLLIQAYEQVFGDRGGDEKCS